MSRLNQSSRIPVSLIVAIISVSLFCSTTWAESENELEDKVKKWAMACRTEIETQYEFLVTSGKLTMVQMFDTFYIPIPNTSPQKFKTQYDRLSDAVIQRILDKYLAKDPRIAFVVAVDRNGYLPTHNSKARDRAKRIFNDRTGLAAARNTEPVLVQKYSRDTGETMVDLSVPIYIHNRHWGALRIGYKP